MSEWIACNNCFCQPSADKHFYLTNCRHIFCDECLNKSGRQKCAVCKSDCEAINIDETSELRSDIASYFTSPSVHLKGIQNVLEFQNSHLSRQLSYHKRLSSKTKQMADEYKKIYNQKKELERTAERHRQEHHQELETLRREYETLKRGKETRERENENTRRENETLKNELKRARNATPQLENFRSNVGSGPSYRDIRGSVISAPVSKRSSSGIPFSISQKLYPYDPPSSLCTKDRITIGTALNPYDPPSRQRTKDQFTFGTSLPSETIFPYNMRSMSNNPQFSSESPLPSSEKTRSGSRARTSNNVNPGISSRNLSHPETIVFRTPNQPIRAQTSNFKLPRARTPPLKRAKLSPKKPQNFF